MQYKSVRLPCLQLTVSEMQVSKVDKIFKIEH